MRLTAKVVGIKRYSFPDSNDKNKKLCGQNVFVTYPQNDVRGVCVDTFKNFESKTKLRVPDLKLNEEYKFILSTDKNNSKSIEMIFDDKGNEIPMIDSADSSIFDDVELPFD